MAITRLTDIVAAMKSKWTYGDKDFAYTFEVNEQHNTQYPYMMIVPPNSEIPEVYNGWEAYNFEIDFFDLYQTASQQAVALEQKWDNLQDLSLEWLDNLMIHYNNPTGANVGIYFLEESIDFQRVKEVANDRLIQIKMRFTLRAVTRCIFGSIPSTYPNQISGLTSWLRADSNVTFSIPTKKVSVVGDGSGNGNGLQSVGAVSGRPLRYTYGGGALDKTMLTFKNQVLPSINNFTTGSLEQFSVFEVSKINAVSNAVFGYYNLSSGDLAYNGDFSEMGVEEITEGTFPNDYTPIYGSGVWQTSVSGDTTWDISGGKANKTPAATNSGLQEDSIFEVGKSYNVSFTVSNRTAGGITTYGGQVGQYLGHINFNGDFSVNIKASISSKLLLNGVGGFDGSISNVSVKEIGQGWTMTTSGNGSSWTIGSDKMTVNTNAGTGANAIAKNTGSSLVVETGKTYKVTYEIKDYVRGTVRARFGGGAGAGTTRNADGVYTEYIIGNTHVNNMDFECSYSYGFEGSVTNLSYEEFTGASIEMGTNAAGNYEVSVSDGTTTLLEKTATVDTGKFHIGVLRKEAKTIYFNYYDSANTFYAPEYNAAFDAKVSFEQERFTIGRTAISDGLIPPASIGVRYLDGDFQEVIIYDRKLNDTETANVVNYLNNKYKIY